MSYIVNFVKNLPNFVKMILKSINFMKNPLNFSVGTPWMLNLPNNPRNLPILRKSPELFAVQFFFKIYLNSRGINPYSVDVYFTKKKKPALHQFYEFQY